MKILKGTPYTKSLVTNIITDLQKKGPFKNEIDYCIQKESAEDYAEFATTETKEVMQNISQIRFKGIYAVIYNKTGTIAIEQKPFWKSNKKVLSKICTFLEQIQPEKTKGETINLTKCSSDFEEFVYSSDLGDLKIKKTVTGRNHADSEETVSRYKLNI